MKDSVILSSLYKYFRVHLASPIFVLLPRREYRCVSFVSNSSQSFHLRVRLWGHTCLRSSTRWNGGFYRGFWTFSSRADTWSTYSTFLIKLQTPSCQCWEGVKSRGFFSSKITVSRMLSVVKIGTHAQGALSTARSPLGVRTENTFGDPGCLKPWNTLALCF